jgi:D-alanyl-D-alanine carboxypeptidase
LRFLVLRSEVFSVSQMFQAFTGRLTAPILKIAAAFLAVSIAVAPIAAQASAKGAVVVIDANTGKTLYSEAADAQRFPASLTKMMTLYLIFERLNNGKLSKDTRISFSPRAAAAAPSKLGVKAGNSITVEQAILALVTKSANDVAIAVAEKIGGSESGFAEMMTRKARQLGMSRTTFRNASGLPNPKQMTTARDMARLGIALREHHPRYYAYFETRSFTFAGRRMGNHNKLLGRVDGVDGIKTGYTRASGFNLVTSAQDGKRSIVAVVMGGKSGGSRDARMRQLVATYLKKGSKTDQGDLVAAVESPAEVIKNKDPIEDVEVAILDLESIAPQKAAKQKVQKPEKMPAVTAYAEEPVKRPSVGLGKIDETVTASVKKEAKQESPGGWMVQIAAADSVDGANALLSKARAKGGKAVASASNFVQQTEKNGQTLHRARFAGFGSQQAAVNACNALKKQKVSCFAVAG